MNCKIGFFGIGHMSSAILDSIITNKFLKKEEMGLYTRNKETLSKYKNQGFRTFENAQELKQNSEMILLGVKPQNLKEAEEELSGYDKTIISILAGVKISRLHKKFKKIIRVMPNLPMTINNGAVAISYDENVSQEEINFAKELFKCSSKVAIIDEKLMDTIITVNGSIPAYVYYFLDILIKDAVARGVEYETAKMLLTETFIGSSKIIQNTDIPIQDHINAVCSKGGTTIQAITTMKKEKLYEILQKANENCINRAIELGKEKQ